MTWTRITNFLRRRMARVTSSVALIPELDGLRALAVLLVIAHHLFAIYLQQTHRLGTQHMPEDWPLVVTRSPLVSWALDLNIGVPLFFVISGFILSIPFANSYSKHLPPPSRSLYLLRRLVRIEPPYLLSMTFLFILLLLPWNHPPHHGRIVLLVAGPHYLASIFYLHNLIYKGPSWITGVAWTLEIEIQFYLLMPFLAELFRIRRHTLRRLIFLAITVLSALSAQLQIPAVSSFPVGLTVLGKLHFFTAGILLADLYLDPPHFLRIHPRFADILTLVTASLLLCEHHSLHQFTWTEPLLIAAFYYAVMSGGRLGRLFASPWLTIPGTMCYTIYLYHYFLLSKMVPLTVRLLPPIHSLLADVLLQLVILLPLLLLVSTVLYLLTERPFIILSHRITRRWR